jgi:hypothetical protein
MDMKPEDRIYVRKDEHTGSFCPDTKVGDGKATIYSVSDGSHYGEKNDRIIESVQVDNQYVYPHEDGCDRRDIQMGFDIADGNLDAYEVITFGQMTQLIHPDDTPEP